MSTDLRAAAKANSILSSLSAADFDLLQPHLARVDLPLRKFLESPNKPIDHVYFIQRGFASVVAGGRGRDIEVGLIGPEGMTGLAVIMGANRTPNATFIQSAGEGLRLAANSLRDAMEESATVRQMLLNYAHTFMVQTSQTALTNGRSKIEERLARWLLMAHDRVRKDELRLTHEFLAIMLGVRRAGVTETLSRLEDKGLLRAARGQVAIRDRKGLEKIADGAYGVPEAEFRRLFGKP